MDPLYWVPKEAGGQHQACTVLPDGSSTEDASWLQVLNKQEWAGHDPECGQSTLLNQATHAVYINGPHRPHQALLYFF